MIHLTDREFQELVDFIRGNFGINLSKKRLLIEARLFSVLAEKNISSFTEYFSLIRSNPEELHTMMNRLTTNHTYFMREPRHFEFMKEVILPKLTENRADKCLRIWSAGCSTGEEAYTAIMVMKEWFGPCSGWDYRILATDISTKVLDAARTGIYSADSLRNLPPGWEKRYFRKQEDQVYLLSEEVKKEVIFRSLNLMDAFPFRQPFDLIFCRNVMIYFEQETKNKLIQKFYDSLKPGGYLLIGHSETVQRDTVPFRYIEPSIYQKG
ncbi:chemotaxis protein CheR [Clostridium sp. W14A]|uniref:protein-glutamate O-methyltransferase n=1 Tax=Caproicibacter fermentans TaxID=2576756 RepID=A0A7G8TFF7_9FIRM|nr:protein-glutamate O-methyltransferase CheR [Caproicibacter fermentans]OCN03174.1 chemotaxis protein CheR [Clostridium sp. W14A]QNK42348.1 protein-glutamate O-methyltransferase CheR [Caproicibacter fermentans]